MAGIQFCEAVGGIGCGAVVVCSYLVLALFLLLACLVVGVARQYGSVGVAWSRGCTRSQESALAYWHSPGPAITARYRSAIGGSMSYGNTVYRVYRLIVDPWRLMLLTPMHASGLLRYYHTKCGTLAAAAAPMVIARAGHGNSPRAGTFIANFRVCYYMAILVLVRPSQVQVVLKDAIRSILGTCCPRRDPSWTSAARPQRAALLPVTSRHAWAAGARASARP
jgi:hypothetical protein